MSPEIDEPNTEIIEDISKVIRKAAKKYFFLMAVTLKP